MLDAARGRVPHPCTVLAAQAHRDRAVAAREEARHPPVALALHPDRRARHLAAPATVDAMRARARISIVVPGGTSSARGVVHDQGGAARGTPGTRAGPVRGGTPRRWALRSRRARPDGGARTRLLRLDRTPRRSRSRRGPPSAPPRSRGGAASRAGRRGTRASARASPRRRREWASTSALDAPGPPPSRPSSYALRSGETRSARTPPTSRAAPPPRRARRGRRASQAAAIARAAPMRPHQDDRPRRSQRAGSQSPERQRRDQRADPRDHRPCGQEQRSAGAQPGQVAIDRRRGRGRGHAPTLAPGRRPGPRPRRPNRR